MTESGDPPPPPAWSVRPGRPLSSFPRSRCALGPGPSQRAKAGALSGTLLGTGCPRLRDHGGPLPPGQQERPSRCRLASQDQSDLNAVARARRPGRNPREEPPGAGGGEHAELRPRFPSPPQGQRRPRRRVGNKGGQAEAWRGPERLPGGSPQPGALQACLPAWGRRGRAHQQTRVDSRSQRQVRAGPRSLIYAARTVTLREGRGDGRSGRVHRRRRGGAQRPGLGEPRAAPTVPTREGSEGPADPARGSAPWSAPGAVGVPHGPELNCATAVASDAPAAGDPGAGLPRLPLLRRAGQRRHLGAAAAAASGER